MASRATCVAILFAAAIAAGCGTVANLADSDPGGRVPFGGVQRDRAWIDRAAASNEPAAQAAATADLLLSWVGDVLSLPYTRLYVWINEPVGYPPFASAPRPAASASTPPLTSPPATPAPPAATPPISTNTPAAKPTPAPPSMPAPGAQPPTADPSKPSQ